MDGERLSYSVIIPTCNRIESLVVCLETLSHSRQSISEDKYEIIVTDDGDDESVRIMLSEKFPEVHWVQGPKRGPAANRNIGASHAKGDWLVFADDDCIPDKVWLESYLQATDAFPHERVFEGRIYADESRKFIDEFSPLNETGGFLWSCNMAIKKSLFLEFKGFDERYPHAAMEDVDLRERLKKAGIGFQFVPDASVQHPFRKVNWFKNMGRYFESLLVFLEIHREKSKLHYAGLHIRKALRELYTEIIPFVVKFRFRGILGQIYKVGYMLLIGFYLFWLNIFSKRFVEEPVKIEPT